jgi:hypothetical protein
LPVTLAATANRSRFVRAARKLIPTAFEDIGAVAVEFAFQRSAEQQRDAARARLEALAGGLHEAQARIASLNADLPAAEEIACGAQRTPSISVSVSNATGWVFLLSGRCEVRESGRTN